MPESGGLEGHQPWTSRKIIDKIKDQVDVLIGVMHMDTENEYGVYGSASPIWPITCGV